MYAADSDAFSYTNQGQSPTVDGIDDVEDFNNTCSALALMGKLCNIVSACLRNVNLYSAGLIEYIFV